MHSHHVDDAQATSDAELILRSRDDPSAFGELYERHARAIHRYLAVRAGQAAAEDLLGDVFVVALRKRTDMEPHPSSSVLPWLYGIAANVLREHHRHVVAPVARPLRQMDPDEDWDAVDARLDAESRANELTRVLDGLSQEDRELLLLIAADGLTPSEAAAAIGITPIAARVRLHRARRRAQVLLSELREASLVRRGA